jgi:simple sugar transport system permease protein
LLLRKPMTSSATLPESLEIPERDAAPAPDRATIPFPVHIGLPLTLVLAIVVGVILSRTILGFRLRVSASIPSRPTVPVSPMRRR